VVFFGFWLSHVPLERFEAFWSRVDGWLKPGGRVFFVDDAHRTPEELIYGEASPIVQRRLNDGSPHRIVKVPHRPEELGRRLRALGWAITVGASAREPFYWGAGGRA
jgi:demethylmenaquinone methyltransferase/2-methoxy-6-polyprenyl-1,4-benzoquinol methylase